MHRLVAIACAALLFDLLAALPSQATVTISGPDSSAASVFFGLAIPPGGALDERGYSGFEYRISGVDPTSDPFTAADMYLIQGNDTNPTQAIGNDLGDRDDLHDVAIDFSLQHNLVGGRNFTFSLTNTVTLQTSVLCWGLNCVAGSNSEETINGELPFDEFNGLQVQVRAQDVAGSSTTVQITGLNGISDIVGAPPFYNETVDPTSAGTIPGDTGRRLQWLIADDLDFLVNEWELEGVVTLRRPDAALLDRNMVRLAIDLVRDPTLPYVVPEPSTGLLVGMGLLALARRRRPLEA